MTTSEFTDLKSGNPKLISEYCSNYKRGWNSTFGYSSAPKLASAKSRQRRSSMQGVTVTSRNAINGLAGVHADNPLNIKAESAFVQAAGKEKGPAVSQALLSTLIISSPRNSEGIEHNSHLQASRFAQCYRASQALGSMPRDCNSLRIIRFIHPARLSSPSCFCASSMAARSSGSKRNWKGGLPRLSFMCIDMSITPKVVCLCVMTRYYHMMQKTTKPGSATTLTGPLTTNDNTIIEVAMCNYTVLIGRNKPSFTQIRPEFIDTYWVIPEYSTVPYGKVSLTRQDRRTFNSMFKDSRLIWAGRKPVQGIVEITTHQGMVNITTPSTIEEISMVPATITNIVTVQGVTHG